MPSGMPEISSRRLPLTRSDSLTAAKRPTIGLRPEPFRVMLDRLSGPYRGTPPFLRVKRSQKSAIGPDPHAIDGPEKIGDTVI